MAHNELGWSDAVLPLGVLLAVCNFPACSSSAKDEPVVTEGDASVFEVTATGERESAADSRASVPVDAGSLEPLAGELASAAEVSTAPPPASAEFAQGDQDAGRGVVIEETDVVLIEQGEVAVCERQIAFSAVALSDPEPFDVVIVADHSESLSWSRDDLSRGLSSLLSDVQGRDVNFFVLTPTQYGEASAATTMISGEDLVPWRDPVTAQPYSDAVTSYRQSCSDLEGGALPCPDYSASLELEFRLDGYFDFEMPPAVAAIHKDTTNAELLVQQTAISDAILNLGLGGSPYEQPLCTLGRYASQKAELLPKRVVFIVLSDEDDETLPRDCITGVHYEHHRDSQLVDCTTDCVLSRYEMTAEGSRFGTNFRCVPVDDLGVPSPENGHDVSSFDGLPVKSCEGFSAGPCSDADVTANAVWCAPSERLEQCERVCAVQGIDTTCTVDVDDISFDACNHEFTQDGQTYANVADYCGQVLGDLPWIGCSGQQFGRSEHTGSWTGGESHELLVWGADSSALVDYFDRTAETAFGLDKYFVEVVGFLPEFSCQPGPGQSMATQLSKLATSPADVFPICEDYAPVLGRVRDYAQKLLQTEYQFSLGERETLEAVVVTDVAGQQRTLSASDYDYDFASSRLTLHPDAIKGRDRELNVQIEIHCKAVVR